MQLPSEFMIIKGYFEEITNLSDLCANSLILVILPGPGLDLRLELQLSLSSSLCKFTLADHMLLEWRLVFLSLSIKHLGTMVIRSHEQTVQFVLNVSGARVLFIRNRASCSLVKQVIPGTKYALFFSRLVGTQREGIAFQFASLAHLAVSSEVAAFEPHSNTAVQPPRGEREFVL